MLPHFKEERVCIKNGKLAHEDEEMAMYERDDEIKHSRYDLNFKIKYNSLHVLHCVFTTTETIVVEIVLNSCQP